MTEEEFSFLGNLSQFSIQQSAFASCPIEAQQRLHNYQICIKSATAPNPIATPSATPNSTAENGGSVSSNRDHNQLIYIFASFVVALLICGIVYRAMKKRSASFQPSLSVKSIESPSGLGLRDNDISNRGDFRASNTPYVLANGSSLSLHSASGGKQSISVRSHSVFASSFRLPDGDNIWVDEELMAWRVDYESVQLEQCLSASTFVEVWEATYRLDRVAVKKLKPSQRLFHHKHPDMVDPIVMGKFIMEIKILSRLDHPRIVAFYGIAWKNESTILCVMEFMPQQDLHTFLRNQRDERPSDAVLTSREWTIEKFHIALDVLDALTYLHSLDPVLVHCDLKSRNVLLDATMQAKLCDFGISKYLRPSDSSGGHQQGAAGGGGGDDEQLQKEEGVMDEVRHLLSQSSGSIRWIAPEVMLAYTQYSEAVDIYAFGVLLSELDTLQEPYEDMRNSKDGKPISDTRIRKLVAKGELQPRFSHNIPLELLDIALRCLSFRPSERPSSLELAYSLRKAAATFLSKRSGEGWRPRDNTSSLSATSTDTN